MNYMVVLVVTLQVCIRAVLLVINLLKGVTRQLPVLHYDLCSNDHFSGEPGLAVPRGFLITLV